MGKLDQDRKIYGFMYQRIMTVGAIFMAISFIIGGIISTVYSRSIAFEIQGILFIILIPIVIVYLTDAKVDHLAIGLPKKHSYFYHFTGGFSFLFSSKKTLFLFIGLAIYFALAGVWASLILFPLYFGYTGSDAGVGMLRSSLFIIGSLVIIALARFHKKISNKSLGIIGLFYSTSLFFSAFLIFTFIPVTNSVNILGIICIIVMMTYSVNGIGAFFMTLYQRVLSVTVPSDKRNSVYSLLPSIGLILQIPLLPIVGQVIEIYGLASGVAILFLLSFVGTGFIFLFQYYDNQEAEQSSIEKVQFNVSDPSSSY